MRLKKILTTFFLICVSVVCFFGCASIEAFRTIDPYSQDSVITDRFVVTLDRNKLGSSYGTIRNAVYDDMILFRNYVFEWIRSFKNDYPEDYYDLSEGITCEVIASQDNLISINLGFADEYCFAMFYGILTVEGQGPSKAMEDIGPFLSQILTHDYELEEMGIFLYKYAMINNASIKEHMYDFQIDSIGTNYYDKYTNLTGFDEDDISVSQVFVYPNDMFVYVDDKIYNNADVVENIDGFTFLAWDLTNKSDDFDLSLYKLAPQTTAWYLIALLISVVFVVVAYIIIKNRKKNKIQVNITKAEAEKNE